MRILSHYFAVRYLGLFATVLTASILILITIELVLNLDDVAAFEEGPGSTGSLFRYLWLRLMSYYMADLLPITSFVAVFLTFAWAGRTMELVAIQAGGVRLLRVVAPVLACALILSCASAILHESWILQAARSWAAEAREDRQEIDFGRRAFWYRSGRAIINIDAADPSNRTLGGVEIFERGEGGLVVRTIRTDRVRIEPDGRWVIEDASIWRFDPMDAAAPPRLDTHVRVDLDLETLGGDALLGADPALLPLPLLRRYLEQRPVDETSSRLRRHEGRYHERLSSPWLLLVFGTLALPFGLRVGRDGRFARPAIEGVAGIAVYFLLRSTGEALAQKELFPVGLTPWLMMGLALAGSAWLLRHSDL